MDKKFLVEQLAERLREASHVARKASQAAADVARDGATPAEKREDARTALEFGALAKGQKERADRLAAELSTLAIFSPKAFSAHTPISLGAIVEVEDGELGRTFFLAPVGAGIELTGPGGDGFLSVVTPVSPIGKAVLGRKVGDSVEVTIKNEPREWTITYVA
jgi:transcription elongation GreA/GreB family factor